MTHGSSIYPIVWQFDHLLLIDQTRLPREFSLIEVRRHQDLIEAVQREIIQSLPIIELALAYGLYLGVQKYPGSDSAGFLAQLQQVADTFATQLSQTLDPGFEPLRQHFAPLLQALQKAEGSVEELKVMVLKAAQDQHLAQLKICHQIGRLGYEALPHDPPRLSLLTYGHTGALATVGFGTALSVVRCTQHRERLEHLYVAETRPSFVGARFSAWEAVQDGLPVTVMADGVVAWAMEQGLIHGVVLGANTIAANGDVANDTGTYGIALAAQAHQIPVIVAAPLSAIDWTQANGTRLDNPTTDPTALQRVGGKTLYPTGVSVYCPRLDITPAALITTIVTETGQASPENLAQLKP
jgi:methylthioribose-1-phosphate isomerase